jgi:hypothetical protein
MLSSSPELFDLYYEAMDEFEKNAFMVMLGFMIMNSISLGLNDDYCKLRINIIKD